MMKRFTTTCSGCGHKYGSVGEKLEDAEYLLHLFVKDGCNECGGLVFSAVKYDPPEE